MPFVYCFGMVTNDQPIGRAAILDQETVYSKKVDPSTDAEQRKIAWPLRLTGWLFKASTKLVLIAVFVVLGVFLGGFLRFSTVVTDVPQTVLKEADGLVVLTGGSKRIGAALRMMDSKQGQRLLISGVNAETDVSDLRRAHGGFDALFNCCVDVERVALNTVGNARETAKWVQKKGYKSLIVVTSGYHMPRSLLEFRRHMPSTKLIPYPVQTKRFSDKNWWRDISNLRFMMSEYLKYVGSQLRRFVPGDSMAALQRVVSWV